MSRPPKCNRPHDHECYTLGHANNTSTNPLSLYGRECPVHGPTARAKERALERRGGCKDCGWWQADEHYSTCPQHLRNQKPKPAPPEPKPDAYVSPHSVNALGEQPIKIPAFDYTEDENGTLHARQTGFEINYPHKDWINARHQFAKDGTWESLNAMLQYVTETNPPPGPPIAVYKPAEPEPKPPLHSRGVGFSALAWSVFTGLYIPYGEHGHWQLALFCVISAIWLTATWALRRVVS